MTRLSDKELKQKIREVEQVTPVDFVETTQEERKILEKFNKVFDLDYTISIYEKVFKPINDIWFRPKYVGFDNFPKRNNPKRPLIFSSNHSGMAFPWDAMVFGSNLNYNCNFDTNRIRALASPMLSFSNFMNPFQLNDLWHRVGAVDATFENFEAMMHQQDEHVLIYPEGVPGIGKGFNKRYQLQQIKTSMLRMSVKYKTDIYPVYTINGEFIDPYSYSSSKINRAVNSLGIPFLPLGPITLLVLLQPWVFYIGFPAQLTFVLGKKISPYNWIKKPYEDISQDEFREMAQKVHTQMQAGLTDARKKYGKRPYKGLIKTIFKKWKNFFHIFPTSWPILFTDFDKRYQKGERDIKIKSTPWHLLWYMLRNPITIAFFIPILGWIPLAIRGYRGNKIKDAPEHQRYVK